MRRARRDILQPPTRRGLAMRDIVVGAILLASVSAAFAESNRKFCNDMHRVCGVACPAGDALVTCLATCADRLVACYDNGCYFFEGGPIEATIDDNNTVPGLKRRPRLRRFAVNGPQCFKGGEWHQDIPLKQDTLPRKGTVF